MGREIWKFRLPEEAFFASVLIYFGIAVITLPDRNKGRVGLVVFKRFQSIVGKKKKNKHAFLVPFLLLCWNTMTKEIREES